MSRGRPSFSTRIDRGASDAAVTGCGSTDDASGKAAGSARSAAVGGASAGRLRREPPRRLGRARIRHKREKKGAGYAEGDDRREQRQRVARQRRFGADEPRNIVAQRVEAHPGHRRVMHSRNRQAERDRAEEQPRAGRPAVDRPQSKGAGRDRHSDRSDDIGRRVGCRSGQMHRRHADIMHEADAEAHRQGARADPKRRRSRRMRGIDANPDHDDANEEGDQRRQHEIVDRARKVRGEHGDEMHRPDAGRQRDRRSGDGEPAAKALGRVNSARQRQADEAALNGDRDRKSHEPRLVRNHHPAPP